jgi:hypothetical protein
MMNNFENNMINFYILCALLAIVFILLAILAYTVGGHKK